MPIIDTDDLSDVPGDVLAAAGNAIGVEISRRDMLAAIPAQFEHMQLFVAEALGRQDGDAWTRPESPVYGYALGAVVTYAGMRWRSLIPSNIFEPHEAGWRVEHEDGRPAPWTQPMGWSYSTGELVVHRGRTWRSLIDANVFEPGNPNDPQAYRWWRDETPPVEPETPVVAAWAPGKVYAVGDKVTYKKATYACVQAHTSLGGWTPTVVPALWRVQA